MNTKETVFFLLCTLIGTTGYSQNVKDFLKKQTGSDTTTVWNKPSRINNASQNLKTKPMYGFIENKGQVTDQNNKKNSSVRYLLPLPGNTVVLRANGFSYDTYVTEVKKGEDEKKRKTAQRDLSGKDLKTQNVTYKYHRVDIDFVNSNPFPEIIASDPSEDFITYYTSGVDQNGIVASHFGKVTFKNIYPKIDVEFIARPGKEKPVEYNFIVHPGGDAGMIRMRYRGPKNIIVAADRIELTLAQGKLIESIPLSYKKQSKRKINIEYKQFEKDGKDDLTVGFSGEIDKSTETLIIDPTPDLVWAKFYGSYGADAAIGIVTDSNAKVYVVGNTTATSTISTTGAYQSSSGGNYDAFILKLNVFGVREWCTYYGGTSSDTGISVVVDDANIYVFGQAWSSGLATSGAYKTSVSGQSDMFLVKFTKTGLRLWCTYYGGLDDDPLGKIAMDGAGNLCIVSYNLGSGIYTTNIGKFTKNGMFLWTRSYSGMDGRDIAIDHVDNIYVCGRSTSSGVLLTTSASYQQFNGGGSDAFIIKLNSNGVHQWSTFYGGTQDDDGNGIAIDSGDYIYMVGSTSSNSVIATSGTHRNTYNSTIDAYVVKFDSEGNREWGTYFGDVGIDQADDISIDLYGYPCTYGRTTSFSPSIATAGAYQTTHAGSSYDTYIAKFSPSGSLYWCSYYGTDQDDISYSCAIDSDNKLYIVGTTVFGIANATIAKFTDVPPCISAPLSSGIIATPYACAVSFALSKPTDCKILAADWDFDDGDSSILMTPVHAYGSAGSYSTSVYVIYKCGDCIGDTTLTYDLEYDPLDIELQDTTIEIQTKLKSQVLSSSASTFSDAWLLQHEAEALTEKSSFVNGSEGVWRNESVYVFDAQRSASGTTNVATDGTYSLYAFDWRSAAFDMVPSWIKANTMTEYSSYSYELENRDVLGIYSSALYDYGGHLPSANGSNMRNKEMGFTSFEYLDGATTGNFIFGSESASSTLSYEVISGYGNVALVRAPISKLQGIEMVNVLALTFSDVLPLKKLGRQVFTNNPVICLQEHPSTPEWTLVVLQNSPGEVWIGSLKMNSSFAPVDIGVLDTTLAHTGRSSLKIQTNSKTFPQQILKLDSAKRYFVSAWVSVNNIQPLTPVLASDLGVVITLKRQNNTIVSQDTLSPEGPIVEGWQQLKGTFTNSINDAVVELSFRPGSGGTAWYDDVRLHPENGNMKSYVYDLKDYRLRAILDEENFASFFYYDMEGNLYLTKKETVQGIKTLTENISYQKH
jgi:hypothetical protein